MILNQLKTIFRRLLYQKVFFGINLLGLTLGLVFAILAFLFAQNEFKYDRHFTNTSDVYLLACNNGRDHNMHFGQPAIFMDKILEDIPEVKSGIRILWNDENLKVNNTRLKATGFIYTDPAFFNFLGWNLAVGNPTEVLAHPMSIVISEKMAQQLFKSGEALGKIINVGNASNFTITGIFKDIPQQTHIKTDFIASISSIETTNPTFFKQWGWHGSLTYFKINKETNLEMVKTKIADLWNLKTVDRPCTGPHLRSELLPFNKIYLQAGKVVGQISAIDYVTGFSIIAALILLISCFNFINLSIAINSKRNIETGIKKVLGANSKLFFRQVFLEMIIYLLLALMFGYFVLKVLLPFVNGFIDKNLTISFFQNQGFLFFVALLLLLILVVCGSIPAILLIKSKTSGLLKRATCFSNYSIQSTQTQKTFRNSLVIAQFAIGILLVISSLIVNKQMKLIRQHQTGFDKEQVMVINNYEGDQVSRYNYLSDLVKKYPDIKSITCGSNIPADGVNNWGGPNVYSDEQNQMQGCGFVSVNDNYLDVIGAEIIAGRNFILNNPADKDKIIITEALAKSLHLDNPVGEKLGELWDNKPREIIGVVKNIEYNTIRDKSLSLVFFNQREDAIGFHERIIIKLQTNNLPAIIAGLKSHWQEFSPDYPMDYIFLDDRFNQNYRNETQTALFMNVMTAVAIFLCCIGLFGLAVFHINARIKEIGIRKVNGAKISEILALLNKDFVIWVIIAFVIAAPVAFYAMNSWLQNFNTKTELSWWIFILSGIIALGIALLTVSWQSWRAATRNPVEALRYE